KVEGSEIELRSQAYLPRGSAVTLLIAGGIRDLDGIKRSEAPLIINGRVSEGPEGGAQIVAAFPPDGSVNLSPRTERFVLAFDGHVQVFPGAILVRDSSRGEFPVTASMVSCSEEGLNSFVDCLAIAPLRSFPPGDVEILTTENLRDATGASLPMSRLSFRVGPEARSLDFEAMRCPIDGREELGLGCVVFSDRQWSLRARVGMPARFELYSPHRAIRVAAPYGEVNLVLPALAPNHFEAARLVVRSLDGQVVERAIQIETSKRPLLPLTITEVCADPEGPEPDQEWVELFHFGDAPISDVDLWLADREDVQGTRIMIRRTIAPGDRVILAGMRFDAVSAGVAAGALVIRVDGALVPGGLANAGEPLILRDHEGWRLARMPAFRGRRGMCVVRRAEADPRSEGEEDFLYASCTPGR
ncbi:MAG: lamin tail domain-containing protein, partial [Sandaracinaceae bacterium]|nr:lamin tail domain-containing protein [Sandaracinaceae bacterium]